MKRNPQISKEPDDGYEEDFDGLKMEDFKTAVDPRLPSPAEIAKSLKKARISIVIDLPSVDYFKKQAAKHGVSYQKMIRRVLRHYIESVKHAA